jgi:hypothetical protein
VADNAFSEAAKKSGQKENRQIVEPLSTPSGSNTEQIQFLRNTVLLLRETIRNQDKRIEEMWDLVFTQQGMKSGFGSMVHIVMQLEKSMVELQNIMIEILSKPGEDVQPWIERLSSYYTQFPEYKSKKEDKENGDTETK